MMTVMGEALMDGLSDAGSTPARSTEKSGNFLEKSGGLPLFLFLAFFHTKDIFLCYYINIRLF